MLLAAASSMSAGGSRRLRNASRAPVGRSSVWNRCVRRRRRDNTRRHASPASSVRCRSRCRSNRLSLLDRAMIPDPGIRARGPKVAGSRTAAAGASGRKFVTPAKKSPSPISGRSRHVTVNRQRPKKSPSGEVAVRRIVTPAKAGSPSRWIPASRAFAGVTKMSVRGRSQSAVDSMLAVNAVLQPARLIMARFDRAIRLRDGVPD